MIRSVASLLRGLRGGPHPSSLPEAVAARARFGQDGKLRHLSAIDIFRDVDPAILQWLEAHTTMVTARRGQHVYTPGETSEGLFLLKAGRVRIYRLTVDGKKLVLSTLEPHTFFGDMPLAGQQMYGAYAEVVEDCVICVLGRADLEHLIQTCPQVAIRLLDSVGRRLVEAESVIEDFAFKGVAARLAILLLRLSAGADGGTLTDYTHQDLADMVGTYRETATQTLDDFKQRGLVALGRRRIQIIDRDGLTRVADR